jgi:hypothetical protein
MDSLGLSEENFDQLGMYRTTYTTGQQVDASGTVMGQSFSDFSGMAQILMKTPEVRNCIANKVLTYALNRVLAAGESALPAQLAATAVQDTSSFIDLIAQIITSDSFNYNSTDSHQ